MAAGLGDLVATLTLKTGGFTRPLRHAGTAAGRESRKIGHSIKGIGADATNAARATNRATMAMGASLKRLGVAAAAYMSIRGGLGLVRLASDAEEGKNKFEQVFKEETSAAQRWIDGNADAFKRSRIDMRDWMATVQGTLVPMGFARQAARKMSEEIVRMGIDLASLNNVASDDEAIRTLRSGLIGNHEALRVLNINITEAMVSQEVFRLGMAKSSREATEQQRILARISLVRKQAADAEGDAIRTSHMFANATKGLSAELKEVGVSIGSEVTPAMAGLAESTANVLRDNKALIPVIADLTKAGAGWASWAGDQTNAMRILERQLAKMDLRENDVTMLGQAWASLRTLITDVHQGLTLTQSDMDKMAAPITQLAASAEARAAAEKAIEATARLAKAMKEAAAAEKFAAAEGKKVTAFFNQTRTPVEKLNQKLAEFDALLPHMMASGDLNRMGGMKAWDDWRNRLIEGSTGLQAALKSARREFEIMIDPANKIKHIIEDMREKGAGGLGLVNLEAKLRANAKLLESQKRADATRTDETRRITGMADDAQGFAKEIITAAQTPLQKFREEIDRIRKLVRGGFIDEDTALREITKINKAREAGDISAKAAAEEIARIRKLRDGGFLTREQGLAAMAEADKSRKQAEKGRLEPVRPMQLAGALQGADAFRAIVRAGGSHEKVPEKQLGEAKKHTTLLKGIWDDQNRNRNGIEFKVIPAQ